MPTFNEETIINRIAEQERAIIGVKNSYPFAANPDSLPAQELPAVIHYSPNFTSETRAFFNQWANTANLRSVLFVSPRADQGGKLKYIENAALPFGYLWRQKFQDGDVINSLLTNTGSVKCWLAGGEYGAGPPLLQFAGIDFIGWIFSWSIVNA